jgi:hypothetical protein
MFKKVENGATTNEHSSLDMNSIILDHIDLNINESRVDSFNLNA